MSTGAEHFMTLIKEGNWTFIPGDLLFARHGGSDQHDSMFSAEGLDEASGTVSQKGSFVQHDNKTGGPLCALIALLGASTLPKM